MATITDDFTPQWVLLPVNNDRTAWKPYGLPTILVVPKSRDPLGATLANSGVWGVRVYVESVPQESRVAGSDHIGILFPDRELYAEEVSTDQLDQFLMVPEALTYLRNGTQIDSATRQDGDTILYTCATGVTDIFTYYSDADYYDLSSISLEVEQLPSDRYNIVYYAQYYTRVRTENGTGDLLCIDVTQPAIAMLRSQFTHPGEVMEEFYRLTPPVYLTNALKSQDTTVELYRPFTDSLQDVADEQILLEKLNWVYNIPYEGIPYLSALLGWDLPYFPQSLDQLRLAVLRSTSRLQSVKGSRQGFSELFRLLGLEILISNLWWSPDGTRLISPSANPDLNDPDAIGIRAVTQIEPLLVAYNTDGFGQLTIPLLHRPQIIGGLDSFSALSDGGDVVIDAYLVEIGSPADTLLSQICNGGGAYPVGMIQDPDGFTTRYGSTTTVDIYGKQTGPIQVAMQGLEIGGYSQLHLTGQFGTTPPPTNTTSYEFQIKGWGKPPVAGTGAQLDRDSNSINLTFSSYFSFDGTDQLPPKRRPCRIYAFATYTKQELIIPASMQNLQSNRFDIQLLTTDSDPSLTGVIDYVDPTIFEFAFDFLFKIKAFHSLLNVMLYTVELTETYEVTTTSIGGDIAQRHDTDMGMLQVPPAKLIAPPGGLSCVDYGPEQLGYQTPDIVLRLRKLANLPEEFAAWAALDNRNTGETYSITGPRIAARPPTVGRTECYYTSAGQDRVVGPRVERIAVEANPGPNANSDATALQSQTLCPVTEVDRGQYDQGASTSRIADGSAYGNFMVEGMGEMEPWCELDGVTDYSYKGRVGDEILYRPTLLSVERYRSTTGSSMGTGIYWAYPTNPVVWVPGTNAPDPKSLSSPFILTGGANTAAIPGILDNPVQTPYLTASYTTPLPRNQNNYLGRLYRDYSVPTGQSLHYSNRTLPNDLTQSHNLALQRPELSIDKPAMHFPGCRFLSAANLQADFHSQYQARPWDDEYSKCCGSAIWCGSLPSWLNAQLLDDTDGSQSLTFDQVPLVYRGNGIPADIPNMGNHNSSSIPPDNVVHSVLSATPDGHPAITLDRVTDAIDLSTDGTFRVDRPLFNSAIACGNTSGHTDYPDGYPGSVGPIDGNYNVIGQYGVSYSSLPTIATFFLGDGVLDGSMDIRWDGGCLVVDCGEPGEILCGLDMYLDQDGNRDWNPDQVWYDYTCVPQDSFGCGSMRLDGQMGNLFELIGGQG